MQREREFMIYVTFTKQTKNSQSLEKNFSLLPPLPNDGETFSGFFNGDLVQSDFEDNTQNPCKWVGFSSNELSFGIDAILIDKPRNNLLEKVAYTWKNEMKLKDSNSS